MRRSTDRRRTRRRTWPRPTSSRVLSPPVTSIHRLHRRIAPHARVRELGRSRREPIRIDRRKLHHASHTRHRSVRLLCRLRRRRRSLRRVVLIRRRVRAHRLAVTTRTPHAQGARTILLRRRRRPRQRGRPLPVVARARARVVPVRVVGRRVLVCQRRHGRHRVSRRGTAVGIGRQGGRGMVAVHRHVRVRGRVGGVDRRRRTPTVPVARRRVEQRREAPRMARCRAVGRERPARWLGIRVLRRRHLRRVGSIARGRRHRAELRGGGLLSGRHGLEAVGLAVQTLVMGERGLRGHGERGQNRTGIGSRSPARGTALSERSKRARSRETTGTAVENAVLGGNRRRDGQRHGTDTDGRPGRGDCRRLLGFALPRLRKTRGNAALEVGDDLWGRMAVEGGVGCVRKQDDGWASQRGGEAVTRTHTTCWHRDHRWQGQRCGGLPCA